eukprot:9049623-Pyramimonas_sp.AAC.1
MCPGDNWQRKPLRFAVGEDSLELPRRRRRLRHRGAAGRPHANPLEGSGQVGEMTSLLALPPVNPGSQLNAVGDVRCAMC